MRLHLPSRLFRAVIALMVAVPSALYAAYTAPTEIVIPEQYNIEKQVDSLEDMSDYSKSSDDIAFRLTEDLKISILGYELMESGAGSRFFTSHTENDLKSLSIKEKTKSLFHVAENESLGFVALRNLDLSKNEDAIYGAPSSTIILNENAAVSFSGNKSSVFYTYTSYAYSYGGAIFALGNLALNDNKSVSFSENIASAAASNDEDFLNEYAYGGAICGWDSSSISLNGNDAVTFSGNKAAGHSLVRGGAIYGGKGAYITLNGNGSVTFSGNSSDVDGGAICGLEDTRISLSENGSVIFSGNSAYSYGGAINGGFFRSYITMNNNGSVIFRENKTVTAWAGFGGAIHGTSQGAIMLSGNDSVEFSGNETCNFGGAIYGGSDSITLSDNKSVIFRGNKVTAPRRYSDGGAIFSSGGLTLTGNDLVDFSENTASCHGGAIHSEGSIYLNDNKTVSFRGNKVSNSVNEEQEYIDYTGGAIRLMGISIDIRNNGSVEFAQNAEIIPEFIPVGTPNSGFWRSNYRLRSIYATLGNVDGGGISLSAAEGKSIIFRDSVYIGSGFTISLNADYHGLKQKGDILFTGATTEADLLAVKGSAGTAEEILNSRTSEVYGMTNLYGGRLRVEDGAVYQGQGITVHEGSEATVRIKDATLNHAGYALTFNAGTTLETEGSSSISGTIVLASGAEMNVKGSVTLDGGLRLSSAGTAATLQGVTLANGSITGTGEDAAVKDASMQGTGSSHALEGVKLENVQFASVLTLLELTDVEFDDACMFSVGAEGTIVLNDALLCVTLPELGTGNEGVLYLDCTQLFHCTVEGDLALSLDTAAVRAAGYRGVQVDFGSDANYESLTLSMNGATYTGNVGTMATFDVVPEPATATLSLLALAALASRRRRG